MLELFFFIKERISSLTVFGEGLRSSKEWGPRCFSSLIPHQTKIWFSKVFPNSVLKFWGEFLSVKLRPSINECFWERLLVWRNEQNTKVPETRDWDLFFSWRRKLAHEVNLKYRTRVFNILRFNITIPTIWVLDCFSKLSSDAKPC